MVLFYTSIEGIDPKMLCYPYIVVNPWSAEEGIAYVETCIRRGYPPRRILIDTGVEKLFAKLRLVDYPEWWIARYVNTVHRFVSRYGRSAEVIYTIPDIPVDYPGRESLWPWNAERTVQYIELFRDRYIDALKPGIPMPVVQGRRDDIKSVVDVYTRHEHLYNEFEVVALGPTCTTRRWRLLARLILTFDRVVSRPFHSFGAHIKAIEKVLKWNPRRFRSFDSSAYYWVESGDGNRRVRGRKERTSMLLEYIDRLRRIGVEVGEPGLNINRSVG